MSKVYTASQAGKILGITNQCVCNLIKRDRLMAIRDKEQWKIYTESISAYVNLRLKELSKEENKLKETLKRLQ